ncbi:MAG: hypothetical protein AMXMBFR12_09430 [Candidatus Babeliales bacterium]
MNKSLFYAFLALFNVCLAQNSDKIQIYITNDYATAVTASYLDASNKKIETRIIPGDSLLQTITLDRFLPMRPLFLELNGKAYQVKFSHIKDNTYKVEVWDAVKAAQEITLQNKTHSTKFNLTQIVDIHIKSNGVLFLSVKGKKKLL